MSAIFTLVFVLFIVFGADFLLAPIRLPAYLHARRNHSRHEFKAHIRKDIGVIMNWCDKCQHREANWIHIDQSDFAELYSPIGKLSEESKLFELETADIKWRFQNDLEWVEVFGHEYDSRTFLPIPQFHNGECGGPNDSCERCAWEADQADAEAAEKRKAVQAEKSEAGELLSETETRLNKEEIKGYEGILWTLWNTVHDFEDALEEFEDLQDELGMLKNAAVRDGVKKLDVWKRLSFCLAKIKNQDDSKYWRRREEVWQTKQKVKQQQKLNQTKYESMDYY